VPLAVVLETIWVLGSAYHFSRQEILDSLEDLTRMAVLEFEAGPVVQDVLAEGRRCRADLSDLLIAHSAEANGCDAGLTFDRRAAKLPFFRLLH
jgi:predicted nucleic-acid-binding protein